MTALLVLLGFYLSDVYKSEEARVSKEAKYMFVSAVDKARGDALEEILRNISNDSAVDTISILAFGENDLLGGHAHSGMQIKVTADSGETINFNKEIKKIREFDSLLSRKEGLKMRFLKDTHFTDAVDDQLKAKLKVEGLNIRYDIMVNDSIKLKGDTAAFGLEDQYDFQVEQSPMDIIRNMWKEIFASIMVFLMVGLSFYFLERSYREQVSLNEARDQFVQNMTHELKSPVSAIGVALEAMQSFGEDDEAQRKSYLKNTRIELSRLNGLIDKVMETSSIKNINEADLDFQRVNVLDLLESITIRLRSAFPKKEIVFDLDGVSAVHTRANILMLKGIINNLLENAIKYGSKSKTMIKVSTIQKGDNILIDIRDNGPGIEGDIAPYIFDRFYRGQKGNTYDVAGFGLGLSLAREYARAMGGEIKLILNDQAEEYPGAHFRVTLPKG